MSEAYACDRCGKAREGSPYADMRVGRGYPRSRYTHDRPYNEGELKPELIDLCQPCVNDLRRWYREGGGDASDISGDWNDE